MRWGRAAILFLLALPVGAVEPEAQLKFFAFELPYIVEQCARDPKCLGDGDNARIVNALRTLTQRPNYSLFDRLRFFSDRSEAARFFDLDGQGCRRSASTENHADAIINFYLPHLRAADPYELFGLLVHEVGHHTGESNHALLDAVGARMRDLLQRQTVRVKAPTETQGEVWVLNPLRFPLGQVQAMQTPDFAHEAFSHPRAWLLRGNTAFTLQSSLDDAVDGATPRGFSRARASWLHTLKVEWDRGGTSGGPRTTILNASWDMILPEANSRTLRPWTAIIQHSFVLEGLSFQQGTDIKNMQPLPSAAHRAVGVPVETLSYESRLLNAPVTDAGPLLREWRIELEISTDQIAEVAPGTWDKLPECVAAFSAEGLNDAVGNPIPLAFKRAHLVAVAAGRYRVVLKQEFPWGLQPAVRRLYLSRLELLFAQQNATSEIKFARVLLPERIPEYVVPARPGEGSFRPQIMADPVNRISPDTSIRYQFTQAASAPVKSGRFMMLGIGRYGAKRLANKLLISGASPDFTGMRWQPAFDGRQLELELEFKQLNRMRIEDQEVASIDFGKVEIVTEDLRYFRWPRLHHIAFNPSDCGSRLDPQAGFSL